MKGHSAEFAVANKLRPPRVYLVIKGRLSLRLANPSECRATQSNALPPLHRCRRQRGSATHRCPSFAILSHSLFETGSDALEFNSAAFSGSTGHVLVYGTVNGTEFMPDANSIIEAGGFAFDNTDTAQPDLLSINNDYWYYDVDDGSLYYDEDADQFMEDAVKIATVTRDGSALSAQSTIKSSDISYSDENDGDPII